MNFGSVFEMLRVFSYLGVEKNTLARFPKQPWKFGSFVCYYKSTVVDCWMCYF